MGGGSGEVLHPPRNSRGDPGGQRPKLAEEEVASLKVVLVAMVGVEVGVVVVARDEWGQRRGIAASAQLSGRPGRPTPKTRGGGCETGGGSVAMVGVEVGVVVAARDGRGAAERYCSLRATLGETREANAQNSRRRC